MTALPTTFACGLYDRMLALQPREIKPDGIDLNFLVIDNPCEIFDRMSNWLEFDACEISSSEYVSRLAAKKLPFVALPVWSTAGSSLRPRILPASASGCRSTPKQRRSSSAASCSTISASTYPASNGCGAPSTSRGATATLP